MKVRTMTLAGVALVAVVALAVLGTWRWASAIGPDVNNTGYVDGFDIMEVVTAFGDLVPTPTPQPSPTPQPTATPQPTPTPAIVKTYTVEATFIDPLAQPIVSEAFCDSGDVVSGGGFKGAASSLASFPLGDSGWHVEGINSSSGAAIAVCIDNPPLRE